MKITYSNEVLNYQHGQYDCEAGIFVDNEIVGLVQYTLFDEELTIKHIFVRPEYRRKGYGSRLIKYIQKENPEYAYKPSLKTELGAEFKHKDLPLEENYRAKYVNEAIKHLPGNPLRDAFDDDEYEMYNKIVDYLKEKGIEYKFVFNTLLPAIEFYYDTPRDDELRFVIYKSRVLNRDQFEISVYKNIYDYLKFPHPIKKKRGEGHYILMKEGLYFTTFEECKKELDDWI